jgi:hypothetical protein
MKPKKKRKFNPTIRTWFPSAPVISCLDRISAGMPASILVRNQKHRRRFQRDLRKLAAQKMLPEPDLKLVKFMEIGNG